ncbi:hypothetical protein MSPP1_003428 [Malassezia sp. CBS 17886]|nr:hypothetical protein MSPP1_003428 [Malassezia sp. CBS 17886]
MWVHGARHFSQHRRRPKVDAPARDARRRALLLYYCLCGEFVLVCDKPLETLPERPVDRARVLRCFDSVEDAHGVRRTADIYKISATQGKGLMLELPDGGLERQYDFRCTRCGLPLGYEHTPPPLKSGGKFTFLLPGALTRKQGAPHPDALLGEPLDAHRPQ